MCGRYVSREDAAIERAWHIGARNSGRWIRQCFNVAPTSMVPMLWLAQDGALELLPARWGLIPSWWKHAKPPTFSFNARSEEAAVKPMWRHSYRSQRCLMPAQGWYEWNEHETAIGPSGRKVHQPYFIHSVTDEVIAFAALWDHWLGPDGQDVLSCALLTQEATTAPSISRIHRRMPVVLAPEQFSLWLEPELPAGQVSDLISRSCRDFEGYRVSTQVNNTDNDFSALLDPIKI